MTSKKRPSKACLVRPCSPRIHDGIGGTKAGDDDHDPEPLAHTTPSVQVPVVRGRVVVRLRESVVGGASKRAVLVLNSDHACECRCEIREDPDEYVSRHVLRLDLDVACMCRQAVDCG